MRNIEMLHPELQDKIKELLKLCEKNGIKIKIGECVRTVAEQNALYAKGRTAPGSIVTNARGENYSSMHQWGIAFDFYLDMDVDCDGKTADDAFNNATHLFNKVGSLGKSIGLEWGGDWTSIKDLPHFQLANWGSTASKLRSLYKTPEEFKKTWNKPNTKPQTNYTPNATNLYTPSKNRTDAAASKDSKYNKTFTTTANLNLRTGAGTNTNIINTIPKNKKVVCYGYYTCKNDIIWLYIAYGKYTGFVCKKYLK